MDIPHRSQRIHKRNPLATLALAHVLWLAAAGETAMAGIPAIDLIAVAVPSGLPLALFVWIVVLLAGLFAARLAGGAYGALVEIARDSPLAANGLGIDSGRLRVHAFVLSAAGGGLAGALHAHAARGATAADFALPVTIAALAMTVLGGRRSAAGAVLGAALLALLPAWLGIPERYAPVLYGVALLVALRWFPDGLAGLAERVLPAPAGLLVPAPTKTRKK